MDEELRKRLEETNRLVEEIREEGRKGELARMQFRQFQAYAAGQAAAWRTVVKVIRVIRGEEDAKPDDPD